VRNQKYENAIFALESHPPRLFIPRGCEFFDLPCFDTPGQMFQPPHKASSMSEAPRQIYCIPEGLWRGVEGTPPSGGQMLVRGFPAANSKEVQRSARSSRSPTCPGVPWRDSAVPRTVLGSVFDRAGAEERSPYRPAAVRPSMLRPNKAQSEPDEESKRQNVPAGEGERRKQRKRRSSRG